MVRLENGQRKRLRTLGPGSLVGEMALYSGQPRSADVVAETPCRAYRLSAERFARLEREDPSVVIQFHSFVVKLLAKRLSAASDEIRALLSREVAPHPALSPEGRGSRESLSPTGGEGRVRGRALGERLPHLRSKRRRDGVHVVDAAAPGAAARLLKRGPEPRVVGQVRDRARGRAAATGAASTRAPSSGPKLCSPSPTRSTLPSRRFRSTTMRIRSPSRSLADRAAGQRLGADVADAGAGRDAGEARVGDHRDVLAPGQVLERGGDLVDLLHARAQRPAADQHEDVARPGRAPALALDGRDGVALAGEDARRAGLAVDAVGIDHARDRWPCS